MYNAQKHRADVKAADADARAVKPLKESDPIKAA